MTKMTILHPDGTRVTSEVTLTDQPSFEEIRILLDPIFHAQRPGAHFEHVSYLSGARRLDMFVDEIGAMIPLPVNLEATKLYQSRSVARSYSASPIFGTAVTFDRKVWF